MARAGAYPTVDFKTSQQFLARDPALSQVVKVPGQSMLEANISYLEQSGSVVITIDTTDEAISTDLASGIYVLTGGGSVVLDGAQAIYRVSDPGSGGIVMDNGNELLLLFQANSGDAGAYDVGTTAGTIPLNSSILAASSDYLTYGGTANAITLTTPYATKREVYTIGDKVRFTATAQNTGATTINVDGLGVKSCVDINGDPLASGYISDETETTGTYDGTSYVIDIAKLDQYHTANLNQFEFGGDAAGDCIANGTGQTSSTAVFYLPISLPEGAVPSSISLVGTFRVEDTAGNSFGNPTLTLSGRSSSKLARITASGISGIGLRESYELRITTASDKIMVSP